MAHKILQIQVLLLAVFFANSVSSLKCYICNSSTDPECSASPVPKKYLKECSNDALEVLADMNRLAKLGEAERIAALLNGTSASSNEVIAPTAAGHAGNDTTSHSPGTLNRTSRNAETTPSTNETGPPRFTIPPANFPKEATFCRKISYHIPTQTNGPNSTLKAHVRIIRSCGWIGDESKSSCKWIGTDGVQMDQCVCTGDRCNSGNYMGSLAAQTVVLMAVMTAGYFYVL